MVWTTGVTTGTEMARDFNARSLYSVKNNSGAISIALAPGASYNLFTAATEAGEVISGEAPAFRTLANGAKATYLVEASNKLVFPSNLHTYNLVYVPFIIRAVLTLSHPTIGSNQLVSLDTTIKRVVDNSVVSSKTYDISNKAARTDLIITDEFATFVNGEADPYVVDGMYLELLNSAASSATVTLTLADVRSFRS